MTPGQSTFAYGVTRQQVLTEIDRRLASPPASGGAQDTPEARRLRSRLKQAREYMVNPKLAYWREALGLAVLYLLFRYILVPVVRSGSADIQLELPTTWIEPALVAMFFGLFLVLVRGARGRDACVAIAADVRGESEDGREAPPPTVAS